ncbi:putative bifunctional diguanylate cyclase/phosphodiesterase [Croceibacterium mercuriale]|uniref:putative bifunctional diguanylate cyclase/phosphodiesterase n=1 Tax=Croceibacterium mercuriale TaxID=1572751 RepID=UPI00068BCC8F|nr:EAL domain-containing protein [Croceibacterium mercuriale]
MHPLRLILIGLVLALLVGWPGQAAATIVPLRDQFCHATAPATTPDDARTIGQLPTTCDRPHRISPPVDGWLWLRLDDPAALSTMPAGWALLTDQLAFAAHTVLIVGADGSVQTERFAPGQVGNRWMPGGLLRVTVAKPGSGIAAIYLGYRDLATLEPLRRVSAVPPEDMLWLGGSWLAVAGTFAGAIVTVLIFSLLVRTGPLLPAQRWYVLWSVLALAYGLTSTNMLALVWPALAGPTAVRLTDALVAGTSAAATMVFLALMERRSLPRWFRRIGAGLALACGLVGVATLAGWPAGLRTMAPSLNVLGSANGLVLLTGVAIAISRRSRTVWLYLISWSPLILVFCLWLAQGWQLVTQPDLVSMSMLLALAIESAALSVLMADRVRRLSGERDAAEQARLRLEAESGAYRRAALTDPLTGLGNRAAFQAQLRRMVDGDPAGTPPAPFMLLLVDVDNLKQINDRLGHDAGDRLLMTIGAGLAMAAGPDGHVARIGGDEYAILLLEHSAAASRIEAALEALQGTSVMHEGRRWAMTFSAGLACHPADGPEPEVLVKHADLALYQVKHRGRRGLYRYDPSLRARNDRRARFAQEAAEGLSRGEFMLHFQPIVRIETGAPVGFEALLRWQHPRHGLLTPATFGEMLTDGRTGHAVQHQAIDMALDALRDHPDQLPRVGVNLTGPDLDGPAAAHRLLQRIAARGIEPSRLCVEVTEDLVLDGRLTQTAEALTVLHDAGLPISLDDFGTGYASLIHLKHLPFDTLKIDRSFTLTLFEDHGESETIIRAIIGLGQGLGKQVVVEGVETEAQRRKLLAMGCRLAQGHLFCRPVPLASLAQAGTAQVG